MTNVIKTATKREKITKETFNEIITKLNKFIGKNINIVLLSSSKDNEKFRNTYTGIVKSMTIGSDSIAIHIMTLLEDGQVVGTFIYGDTYIEIWDHSFYLYSDNDNGTHEYINKYEVVSEAFKTPKITASVSSININDVVLGLKHHLNNKIVTIADDLYCDKEIIKDVQLMEWEEDNQPQCRIKILWGERSWCTIDCGTTIKFYETGIEFVSGTLTTRITLV